MPELHWIDWTLLAVLLASVVIGIVRGFVFEVLSLLGWVVAWVGAQWLAADVSPHMPIGTPGSAGNMAATYVLCFVLILLAWSLLARLIRLLVHATPLSIVDRALGAGFGLLRGAVLLLALATAVTLSPAAQTPSWQASEGAHWLGRAMAGLKPLLPGALARHLPT
jgi:membrane protein required for colicin V production